MSDLKQRVELLPCPFCGGEGYFNAESIEALRDRQQDFVACHRCEVRLLGNISKLNWRPYVDGALCVADADIPALTVIWNTRALTEREAKLTALLKRALISLESIDNSPVFGGCNHRTQSISKIKDTLKSLGIEGEG